MASEPNCRKCFGSDVNLNTQIKYAAKNIIPQSRMSIVNISQIVFMFFQLEYSCMVMKYSPSKRKLLNQAIPLMDTRR